jgi:spore germination cell wall hydrolase CwlJ-like protein
MANGTGKRLAITGLGLAVSLAISSPASAGTSTSSEKLDEQTECMAKAIMREAGAEPHEGKLAVAQTILNRIEDGRFRGTVCGVINQPGQFFKTAHYHPNRGSGQWQSAVDAAQAAIAGTAKRVVGEALYFAPVNGYKPSFLKARKLVARLGGHLFYR